MRTLSRHLHRVAIGVMLLQQGCAAEVGSEGDDGPVALQRLSLASFYTSDIWDTNDLTFCFQPFEQASIGDPDWAATTVFVRAQIEQVANASPTIGLSLSGWDLCSNWDDFEVGNQPLDMIQILVWMDGGPSYGATRRCGAAVPISAPLPAECQGNHRPGNQTVLALSAEHWAVEAVSQHEFMHVLGFGHEFNRDDWDGSCTGEAGGQKVADIELTAYDGDSLTNSTYCHTNTQLTALDVLGLEICYPASRTHGLRATHGFILGNGDVLGRTNSFVSDEWTIRGAGPDTLSDGVWTVNGTSIGTADRFSSTELAATTPVAVTKSFTDFMNRSHVASGYVRTNNALHAAIVRALM